MLRFVSIWLISFILTVPSWWLLAAHDMANASDLVWTAGFAATLASAVRGLRPSTVPDTRQRTRTCRSR